MEPSIKLKFLFQIASIFWSFVDPFHFDTDPDPVPMITDPDPDPDPDRILTKIQSFEISSFF